MKNALRNVCSVDRTYSLSGIQTPGHLIFLAQ